MRYRRFDIMFASLALGVLGACGGSDSSPAAGDGIEGGDASGDVGGELVVDDAAVPVDAADGAGTATVTMADGTVYEFEMSECDTSVNSPDTFLVDPGYDLFGTSADGFRFGLIRAAFEEPTNALGDIEGRFDENGSIRT